VTADRLAALVFFVAGVQYARLARAYHGLTVADVVGPSAYPIILGGLMALLAVVLFVQSRPKPAGESFWNRHGRPLVLILSLSAYILLFERVGFLLITFIFLALAHVGLGEKSWIRAVGIGLAITASLWFIFDRTLDLRLPAGLLGGPW
jgi:putative tricarboxylic transport membrane protein